MARPAPELLPAVRWQIRFLKELRPASPALQPRLVTLIGSMEALAGRLTFWNLQDPAGAEDHLRTALAAAQEADHPELAAYVLAAWSYVPASRTAPLTSADGNGRLTEAVDMVEEAQRLAATSGSPLTETYVASAASEIHACDGDERASRRSIERAEAALSRVEADDPLWIGPGGYDPVRLRMDEAANLVRFRKPEAVDALRSVLEQYPAKRRQSRIFLYPLTNLARARRLRPVEDHVAEREDVGRPLQELVAECASSHRLPRGRQRRLRRHRSPSCADHGFSGAGAR